MRVSKIPTDLAKNASKLHKRVLELLTSEESIFKHYSVRQEVSVKDINPNFPSRREKIDVCIRELKLCIEIHGLQHYQKTCFGGIDGDEAQRKFKAQQERDIQKQMAVEEAGWAYLVVKYNEEKITLDEITDRIHEALKNVKEYVEIEREVQKIKSNSKLQSRGFQKKPEGFKYQWAKNLTKNKKEFSNDKV